MTQRDATRFAFHSSVTVSALLRLTKTEMLGMHVTQDEFKSVNELHKQMAYAFLCYLISWGFFFVADSKPPPQLRRKVLIITPQMKRALHIHFQLRHKILRPWKAT